MLDAISYLKVKDTVTVNRKKREWKHGPWSKNEVFGRCDKKGCNGLTIYGICRECLWAHSCCECHKVHIIQTNTWKHIPREVVRESPGICPECTWKLYPDVMITKVIKHTHCVVANA